MFDIQNYPQFILAIVVFQLIPGAGTLAIVNASARSGIKMGMAAVAGTLIGDAVYIIGHQAKQPVDHQVIKVFALPLAGRHLVKIFADNQLSHSFYFRFSDFPAAQVLYLGMSEIGYQTWTLRAAPSKKQACV